jgi:hypothetical protein
MATRIPEASRSAACDAIVDRLDAGAAAGYVEIRTGTQPADPDDVASGTLLATIVLNDPAFGAAAAGVATADVSPALTVAAVATGTAGWFRAYDDNDASVMDGSITGTGGGGDMELDSTSITSGQDVTINSWTVTMPAA